MTEEVREVLVNCRIRGNNLYLPDRQLSRDLYVAVDKQIRAIGGKWKGGKTKAHVFDTNPVMLLETLLKEDYENPKTEFQMFFTPADVVTHYMLPLLNVEINRSTKILEPSAGSGNIIKVLFDAFPEQIRQIDACEIFEPNARLLETIPGVHIIGSDFLSIGKKYDNYYDLIIANPPFAKNQDIDHFYKMCSLVKPGGQVISIMSKHWVISSNKRETAFRNWLDENYVDSYFDLPQGLFAESGTKISVSLLSYIKPGKTEVPTLSFQAFKKFSI